MKEVPLPSNVSMTYMFLSKFYLETSLKPSAQPLGHLDRFFLLFVTSCEGKPCHTTTSAAAVQQAHTIDEARPCTQHRVTATASPQCDFANQNPLNKLSKHTTQN